MGLGLGDNYESAPWHPLEWCLNTNGWRETGTDAGKKGSDFVGLFTKMLFWLTDWV